MLLRHWTDEIARIALAVDYEGNGYRRLVAMCVENEGLLSAMLAVAASHRSKWMRSTDTESSKYARRAIRHLQSQLKTPAAAKGEGVLATMLCLTSYEVFNGSRKWMMHYRAVAGWIRSQKDTSALDPFFKTWIAMIETQMALNTGASLLPEIESWLDVGQSHAIDPFFAQGCSVLLPRLMLKASRLSRTTTTTPATAGPTISPSASLHHRASLLQDEIASTAASPTSPLRLSVTIPTHHTGATNNNSNNNNNTAAAIAAEIFRHALHIYVFRASHPPSSPLDARARRSVDEALSLLALVHDAAGPLSNMGWALVVVGVEVAADSGARAFLRSKWAALHLLGIENSLASEGIVLEWWRRWDEGGKRMVGEGEGAGEKGGWLELMRLGGEELVPLV
ncbi:uncharacterized protein LTHEOB_9976 [Lasiodiplodia theobromae]|uniref:uncharacterized protein n=1 Tax=Lasiodiplodia theobromae TaxID=45133 RepID=UPI0015C3C9B4|nr:uncharacterized protein LTHEOB_9976 [Lasiodiplodia theobromae]KAF4539587.1 hypothetical protein LTHEOB_9976 [Lasiodiplodia theobromae]